MKNPGGNICNIALNAAFLPVGDNKPISIFHLAKVARRDYIKIDKMTTPAEFGAYYQQAGHKQQDSLSLNYELI